MQAIAKKEADAYDRMIDAATDLADLIDRCGIELDEYALEELSIFLGRNALTLKKILGHLRMQWP